MKRREHSYYTSPGQLTVNRFDDFAGLYLTQDPFMDTIHKSFTLEDRSKPLHSQS